MPKRNIFILSVVVGFMFWAVFAWFKIEPWDSPYGWIIVSLLGLSLGFIGNESPWLWPLGIFLGEVLFGLGSLVKSLFFYSGGGANLFFPLGLMFLVPFTVPALMGSFVGFGLRKALNNKRWP
ncbi:hypothetical protein [Sulfuriflexus mobilis]|uniref:hypothetical protein n=1 Tax=Sulfuriflexus mobilis TaxID=1811807 RepID=UPI000F82AC57|nr:hypothetical protein [Sulfuriflexus mobilis]